MTSGVLTRSNPGLRAREVVARAATRVLRVPMLLKLIGANLLIVVAAVVERMVRPDGAQLPFLVVTLTVSLLVTTVLAWLALRPIALLEETAEQVSGGDFTARVPVSPVADDALVQLASTMNRLLDRVQADRAQIQYLAGRVVRARDIERESVARELRDSLAQMVAGVALQLSLIKRVGPGAESSQHLETASQMVNDLNNQMRDVAESLYPGTIAEFGLGNALRTLGRLAARRSHVEVNVETPSRETPLMAPVAAAFYRVAEEALRNVTQHSQATQVRVSLTTDNGITLDIEDNGRGVDVMAHDPMKAGLGLFSARAVLALTGGTLQLSGAPGRGTRVSAHLPADALSNHQWRQTS